MKIFTVTKDSNNFGINNDYNVVSNDLPRDPATREFAARNLTYDQAVQLRQELERVAHVESILAGN